MKRYNLTDYMHKVAITIPTMNRPDFLLRQFEFCERMQSPHPIYILDSSNEENARKIKDGIKRFKDLNITYTWAPPGKDSFCRLLPMVKEKYCIQMGDDDLVIPETITECAEFLEGHPDYATCTGKQVNIRFAGDGYNQPYGLIARQSPPLGRSIEDGDLLLRARNFWADPNFICFTVRRTELERKIRDVTKSFSLTEHMTEFILWSMLIIPGKAKVIDKLGYFMQISGNRYSFATDLTVDFMLAPELREQWSVCEGGISKLLEETGVAKEDSRKTARWMFVLYLARQFNLEIDSSPIVGRGTTTKKSAEQKLSQKIRHLAAHPLLKKIYYKFRPPQDPARPESKYFKEFKTVKDFLERDGVRDAA